MTRNTKGGAILKIYLPHCPPLEAQRVAEVVNNVIERVDYSRHAHVSVQSAECVNPLRCVGCISDQRTNN